MDNNESARQAQGPTGALHRVSYESGHFLSFRDLRIEQRYLIQRLRRHRRHLHGWGVVCGMQVVPAHNPSQPWAVFVCPGYALGPHGDEIFAKTRMLLDLRDALWLRQIDAEPPPNLAYVSIRYCEDFVRPVANTARQCGCQDSDHAPSRIRDGFHLDVLWYLPSSSEPPDFDLCEQSVAPCPDCPSDPHIILASLTLPRTEADMIEQENIDNWSFRRQIT